MKMSFSPETYALLIGKGGGGGGSGLPTPTEEDVGKTMMVQANYTKGACIVPEQTVTTVYDSEAECCIASLSNVDSSVVPPDFSPAIMVIDGVETVAEITNIGPTWNCPNGELPCFNNWGGGEFDTEEAGTHTVALYLAVVSYTWVPAYPSVRVLSCEATETTLVASASWQEIYDMVSSGLMVGIKDEYEMHATMYFVLDVSDYPGGYKVTTTLPSQQGFADWVVNSTSDYPTWTFE